jgi:hypothetical protein
MHGEPKKLMQPYDPDHNGCGLGDTLQYPFIYFVNPLGSHPTTDTVCVKKCPSQNDA